MNELLLIIMGAIIASIFWIILYARSATHAHQEMLIEKERSFQAGFTHARNLICFKPVAPNRPCFGGKTVEKLNRSN